MVVDAMVDAMASSAYTGGLNFNEENQQLAEFLENRGWYTHHPDRPLMNEEVMDYLGHLGLTMRADHPPEISTISPNNYQSERYLANTNEGMGFHTDNVYLPTPCKYLAMYCIKSAERGGATQLSDIRAIIPHIDGVTLAELRKNQWVWQRPIRIGKGPSSPQAVLGQDGSIRWWRHGLKNQEPHLLEIASTFDEMIDTSSSNVRFTLTPGELVIIDNYRIMHAREPFSGNERELLRVRIW